MITRDDDANVVARCLSSRGVFHTACGLDEELIGSENKFRRGSSLRAGMRGGNETLAALNVGRERSRRIECEDRGPIFRGRNECGGALRR